MMPMSQTLYDVLEVPPTAGQHEIHQAYLRAKQTYSSNNPALYSMFTEEEARELLKMIDEAYYVLSNQARRQSYDAQLISGQSAVVRPQPSATPKPQVNFQTEEHWEGHVRIQKKVEDLPHHQGRTKFGVYTKDSKLEEEIALLPECTGAFLKRVRSYKGISLDQLSEELRVSKATLAAIESDDWVTLPAAVFTRGFIVQMARLLAIDDKRFTELYMANFRSNRK